MGTAHTKTAHVPPTATSDATRPYSSESDLRERDDQTVKRPYGLPTNLREQELGAQYNTTQRDDQPWKQYMTTLFKYPDNSGDIYKLKGCTINDYRACEYLYVTKIKGYGAHLYISFKNGYRDYALKVMATTYHLVLDANGKIMHSFPEDKCERTTQVITAEARAQPELDPNADGALAIPQRTWYKTPEIWFTYVDENMLFAVPLGWKPGQPGMTISVSDNTVTPVQSTSFLYKSCLTPPSIGFAPGEISKFLDGIDKAHGTQIKGGGETSLNVITIVLLLVMLFVFWTNDNEHARFARASLT